jgi:hypothetical protein
MARQTIEDHFAVEPHWPIDRQQALLNERSGWLKAQARKLCEGRWHLFLYPGNSVVMAETADNIHWRVFITLTDDPKEGVKPPRDWT